MKRGAIVVVAARGAYTGKPRPAVVVQSELFNPTHPQVMIDKIISVPRVSISAEIGACDAEEMEAIGRGLRRWLGLE